MRSFAGFNDPFSSAELIDAMTRQTLYEAPARCATSTVLFEHSSFRGSTVVADHAVENLSKQKFNDKVSPVCVPAGKRVTLWRDSGFKGKRVTLIGPYFRIKLGTMGWNDNVSPFRP